MAGAGYKLFNTGDVLTAAQVNTYLQEQTVMVFADAAARTTALSGVLAEGMISYLKDTDAVEKYDGSSWVSLAGGASPLTTKGDLYTYSTTDARLPVGNNGETLVADSSTATGLKWAAASGGDTFAAGKNKIINGAFDWNQRAFSSTTSSSIFGFDRWLSSFAGDGTSTMSAQTFTAGAAPVAGYEATNFVRLESTGQTTSATRTVVQQRIEDVRTFANQTVTVSFWAKASSGTPSVAANFLQNFGSGGSSAVSVNGQKIAITTSWARYSFTFNIPSISGKTLGASSYVMLRIWTSCGSDEATSSDSLGIQTATIDIWGVQVEAGSSATDFQTATGSLQGELAACQRYYFRYASSQYLGVGHLQSTTAADFYIKTPVTMRTSPTYAAASGTNFFQVGSSAVTASYSTIGNFYSSGTDGVLGRITVSGFTAGQGCAIVMGSASAWVEGSAEL